jgi:hypothetical protein
MATQKKGGVVDNTFQARNAGSSGPLLLHTRSFGLSVDDILVWVQAFILTHLGLFKGSVPLLQGDQAPEGHTRRAVIGTRIVASLHSDSIDSSAVWFGASVGVI